MRYIILTLTLALSAILFMQLNAAQRLLAEQHTLLAEQRAVISAQQHHITQTLRVARTGPLAFAQR